jgi:hypothetical protein
MNPAPDSYRDTSPNFTINQHFNFIRRSELPSAAPVRRDVADMNPAPDSHRDTAPNILN